MRWPRAQRLKAVALSVIMTVGVTSGLMVAATTPSSGQSAALQAWVDNTLNPDLNVLDPDVSTVQSCEQGDDEYPCEQQGYALQTDACTI